MIVNLKYVKKQWSDFLTVEIAYFRFADSSPLKTLSMLTILQCWCQFFWMLLLSNSWLIRWHLETDGKSTSYCHRSIKCTDFYAYLSQMFQICDMITSFWASYHLRVSLPVYSDIHEAKTWMISNDLYIILSMYLIFSSIADGIELCAKALIMCLFATYKIYVLYKMYKQERSSHIVLEQRSSTSNDCPSKASDDEGSLLSQNHFVEIDAGK